MGNIGALTQALIYLFTEASMLLLPHRFWLGVLEK